ncbi:MAG: DUF262 domain-containing protein [Bacteroidaceae bacterium]|nr:DUF262 domain-containing protein [Bacteroidaceae bacterium]
MNETQIYDKNFAPLPIADLLDGKHHFVIPSFQRGYRWEEKQVTDLLEDIKQFANDDNVKSDSYFLQPVVVKACKYNGMEAYEVLDGQQRLTTMLLLLKRLMKRLGEDEREMYQDSLYDIVYTNRPQLDFDNPQAAENIDSYYLSEAKMIIDDWFKEQTKNKQNLNNFTGALLYDQKRQVKIIWYAIEEDSEDLVSINIFNRLNKGKISLTSSELIKALFIMDYDLRANEDKLPAEQLSMEWNEMERKFQDDNFWYFISDDNRGTQTRIDVLFDFVTCRDEEKDTDYSYREFQKLYDFCRDQERNNTNEQFVSDWSDDIKNMQDAWKQVRKTFDRLVAWYEDNLYYHYVGYLVAIGFTPLQIYNHLETEKRNRKLTEPEYEWTVEDTMLSLRKKMMDRFKQDNRYIKKDTIDEFEYKSEYVPRVLLLFNVECCRRGQNVRFAFDKYKKENWDVEHVDSQNDATLQEYDDRMRWMKNVNFILNMEHTDRAKELANECQNLIVEFTERSKVNVDRYRAFYQTINKFYSAESGENDSEVDLTTKKKDYLSNLTLLDSATNREYKDAPFAYKRYCIVKNDRLGDRFIPLCTRNLFLKYYTDSNNESSYLDTMRWNSSDREGYMNAMHEAVDPIFDSVIVEEKEVQS